MTQNIPPYNPHDPYTQETTKVAELKDQFGKTRFKIALTDYDDNEYPYNDDLRTFDTYFQVTVVSYCYGDSLDNPVTLVEEVFTNIDAALKRFYELVQQYRHLINVETKGWQDIRIYAEKIEYRKIDPDCCRNCKWAKAVTPKICPPEELRKHKGRFVCMNPAIAKDVSDFEKDDPHNRDNYYTYSEPRSHFKFDLAPYTQEDGICKHYEDGRSIHHPEPKHQPRFAQELDLNKQKSRSLEMQSSLPATDFENAQFADRCSQNRTNSKSCASHLKNQVQELRAENDACLVKISDLSFENTRLRAQLNSTQTESKKSS